MSQLANSRPAELDMYERLEACGFSFREDPTDWPDYALQAHLAKTSGCLRFLHLCPQQGRYFGDEGSLVAFIDQLGTPLRDLKARNLPPYGIMAAWRLPSDVVCEDDCDVLDDVLGPDMLATSVVFEDDLFTAGFPRTFGDFAPDEYQCVPVNRRRGRTITL